MTTSELLRRMSDAEQALYPIVVEHGTGCPCRACRIWMALAESEPVFSDAYARVLAAKAGQAKAESRP